MGIEVIAGILSAATLSGGGASIGLGGLTLLGTEATIGAYALVGGVLIR